MTEPWTARNRDQLLTRVSRTTVMSGALALVATAGVAYGLAGATTAATLAADPAAGTTVSSGTTASSGSSAGTAGSTGATTTSVTTGSAATTAAAATPTVAAASSAPVATSGGS